MQGFYEQNSRARIAWYILNTAIGLSFTLPFYWTVATSLKPPEDILVYPPRLYPSPLTIQSYSEIWLQRTDFPGWYLNSAIVAILTVLATVTVSSLAGYGFAKLEIPGKNLIFFSMLISLMVPHQSLLIPLFSIMQLFDLINTRAGLVIIYTTFGLPFSIFMMRNSFETIPTALLEAARIDGAGEINVWARVVLPLALPGVATVAVLTFLSSWNEFLIALVFTTTDPMKTIPVGLAVMLGIYGTRWEILTAVATSAFVPVIILFIAAQRFFLRGVASGAVK